MKRAVKWLVSRDAAALFLDPGMGKTSISYAAVKILLSKKLAKGALVVAPRRPAISVWPAEQKKWADFAGLSVGLLHGPHKDKVLQQDHDIYVVTYDGLEWLFGEPEPNLVRIRNKEERAKKRAEYKAREAKWLPRIARIFSRTDILIFDELSKMRNSQTGRHKRLKKYLGRFARRWGLTGSPAANNLLGLFGQVYALDLGRSLGQYITHYRRAFFDAIPRHDKDDFPPLVPKPEAEQQIFHRLRSTALRLDGDDYLKLPELMPIPLRFEMSEDTWAMYEEMQEQMMLSLKSGEVFTARKASTVSQKCRQITSGAMYHDLIDPETGMPRSGPRKYTELHDEKLEMMEDLIEELQGHQLFVAYEFHHELERMLKRFGKDTPNISRGTSDKRALELEKQWNAGELNILIAHPQSVGHGLNLQESSANHILWYSNTWDFELYDQFNRRLRRQGSKAKRVFVYHLIARDTVDESVYYDKFRKDRQQRSLLQAFKLR